MCNKDVCLNKPGTQCEKIYYPSLAFEFVATIQGQREENLSLGYTALVIVPTVC